MKSWEIFFKNWQKRKKVERRGRRERGTFSFFFLFLFFEWNPMAGPDGEERVESPSLCSSKRGCDETAWLMKRRFSLAPQRAQPFLIPIHH